ncbi:hypothetical protein [Pseudomonas entomophila]|uniref:hypothetical protein n=1 Tax=Pseudomonas entomophila TaxID=312306 RepID=UPI001F00B4CC|nr:hypothetical protein [Pseudomonas entomophila]MCG8291954.1 hypothetical protein [Pseudomonas entomophila]
MQFELVKKFIHTGYGKVVAILTVIATILTICDHFRESGPEHNPALFGRWESNYQVPTPSGMTTFNVITEYFRNGRYQVNGTLGITGAFAGTDYNTVIQISGNGTWTADDDFLTFTMTGRNAKGDHIQFGDQNIRLPDMNKDYLPGNSDELKIVSIAPQRMVLEGRDTLGNPFTIVSTRQKSSSSN